MRVNRCCNIWRARFWIGNFTERAYHTVRKPLFIKPRSGRNRCNDQFNTPHYGQRNSAAIPRLLCSPQRHYQQYNAPYNTKNCSELPGGCKFELIPVRNMNLSATSSNERMSSVACFRDRRSHLPIANHRNCWLSSKWRHWQALSMF